MHVQQLLFSSQNQLFFDDVVVVFQIFTFQILIFFFFFALIQEVAIKIRTILQKQQEEKTSKLHKC